MFGFIKLCVPFIPLDTLIEMFIKRRHELTTRIIGINVKHILLCNRILPSIIDCFVEPLEEDLPQEARPQFSTRIIIFVVGRVARCFISKAIKNKHDADKRKEGDIIDELKLFPSRLVISWPQIVDCEQKLENCSDNKEEPEEEKETGCSMTFHFVHLLKNCNKNLYNEWLKGDENVERFYLQTLQFSLMKSLFEHHKQVDLFLLGTRKLNR